MNMEIAERLYSLRKEHNYSQEELANMLGVSRQAVSKWERGEASPDTDNLIALSKLYHVSLDELLFSSESKDNKIIEDDENETIERDECGCHHTFTTQEKISTSITSIWAILMVIAFIVVGSVWNIWHPTWICFLSIPLVGSLANAIQNRKISHFAYPVLVTIVYLLIGFLNSGWHPYWFLFVTIPLYYMIANVIDGNKK